MSSGFLTGQQGSRYELYHAGAPAARQKMNKMSDYSCPRKAPNLQRILAEQEFPVFGCVEIEMPIHEFQFLVHRQLPARTRIAGPPDQLFASEFFVRRFEKRKGVLVRKLFRERQLVRFGGADPDLREALQPEHLL